MTNGMVISVYGMIIAMIWYEWYGINGMVYMVWYYLAMVWYKWYGMILVWCGINGMV